MVREAAEILGVTEQAVRQRIGRDTLPTMPDAVTEGGDEPRYYIPREAVEKAVEEAKLSEEAVHADGPLRITIHRPGVPRTVRIETGPEGTEVHLDG